MKSFELGELRLLIAKKVSFSTLTGGLVGIFLLSGLLLTHNITAPWNDHWNAPDGALFSTIARNTLDYGAWNLGFAQARNPEPATREQLNYYQRHPPLVPLLVASAFALFGESEAVARAVPVAATLGAALLVFLLTQHLYSSRVALIATFLLVTFPGIAYFGQKVGYEAPTLFFILLTLWFYRRFCEEARNYDFAGVCGAAILGLWTDWPMYFLILLLAIHALFGLGRGKIKVLLGLPLLALVSLAIHGWITWRVAPGAIEDLLYQGMTYAGLIDRNHPLATKYEEALSVIPTTVYIRYVLKSLDTLFSYPALLLALLGMWIAGRHRLMSFALTIPLMLLGVALANCLAFWVNAFYHLYWFYYFAPPIAMFGAVAADGLLRWEGAPDMPHWLVPVFLGILVITGAFPSLITLHGQQMKFLPESVLEQADFTRTLGQRISTSTEKQTLILSNLLSPRGGNWTLSYYSHRRAMVGVDTVPKLVQEAGVWARGEVDFLLWPTAGDSNLRQWLDTRGHPKDLDVQGHKFLLYRLPAADIETPQLSQKRSFTCAIHGINCLTLRKNEFSG